MSLGSKLRRYIATLSGSELDKLNAKRKTLNSTLGGINSDLDVTRANRGIGFDALEAATQQVDSLKRNIKNVNVDIANVPDDIRSRIADGTIKDYVRGLDDSVGDAKNLLNEAKAYNPAVSHAAKLQDIEQGFQKKYLDELGYDDFKSYLSEDPVSMKQMYDEELAKVMLPFKNKDMKSLQELARKDVSNAQEMFDADSAIAQAAKDQSTTFSNLLNTRGPLTDELEGLSGKLPGLERRLDSYDKDLEGGRNLFQGTVGKLNKIDEDYLDERSASRVSRWATGLGAGGLGLGGLAYSDKD